MAGTAITITTNADKIGNEVLVVAKSCDSPAVAMRITCETVRTSVVRIFQVGGRPTGRSDEPKLYNRRGLAI